MKARDLKVNDILIAAFDNAYMRQGEQTKITKIEGQVYYLDIGASYLDTSLQYHFRYHPHGGGDSENIEV